MSLTVKLTPGAAIGVRFVGDSISSSPVKWWTPSGGMAEQMAAAANAVPGLGGAIQPAMPGAGAQGKTVVSGAIATVKPTPVFPLAITSYGHPGGAIVDLIADGYPTCFGAAPMTLLVLGCAINDFNTSPDPTTHLNNYRAFLDAAQAHSPAVQVLCLGALAGVVGGEQWLTGPSRYSSGLSTSIYDANIQTACSERPTWTEYARQSDWSLTLNMALNIPGPGATVGACTFDGVHPTVFGQLQMASHAFPHLVFSL